MVWLRQPDKYLPVVARGAHQGVPLLRKSDLLSGVLLCYSAIGGDMALSSWLCASLCASALLFTRQPAQAKQFTVLTGEWFPYVSETLADGGTMACIVLKSLEASGHSVKFNFVPWSRNEQEVQSGAALATFPWSRTDAFEATCHMPEPLGIHRMVFFYRKDKLHGWDYTGLEDLKRLRVGGSRGYAYVEMFEKAGVRADYAQDVEKSFAKLLFDRIDVVPESEAVGWAVLEKGHPKDVDRVAVARTPLYVQPLHLMISKTHPDGSELLEAFERGLAIIKSDGRYEEIYLRGGCAP